MAVISGSIEGSYCGRSRSEQTRQPPRTLDPLIKSRPNDAEIIEVFSQPGAKARVDYQLVTAEFPTERRAVAKFAGAAELIGFLSTTNIFLLSALRYSRDV